MTRVIARVCALPGRESTVEVALRQLVLPTRGERGCVRYELFQGLEDPHVFIFDETWESEAAHETHMRSPHLQRILAEAGPFLAGPPDIRRYPG